jgi:PadR family transcriptional regulator PadR
MKSRDNFKKGSVEMLILQLLLEKDSYGYEISQSIKERSNQIIIIPEGSLYPTLYKMTEKGLISDYKKQIGKRLTRIYYHIESNGKAYLEQLIKDYYEVNSGIQAVLKFGKGDCHEKC